MAYKLSLRSILNALCCLGCVSAILLFTACGPGETDNPLEANLRLAGKNRIELKKVLDYYNDPDDSLKLLAAEFLISNMDAHKTRTSPYTDTMISYLKQIDGLNYGQSNIYIDSCLAVLSEGQNYKFKTTSDLSSISATFLIENIDQSFEIWQESPWEKYVSFENYCNYLLPYHSGTGRLQDWRDHYHDSFVNTVDTFVTSEAMDSVAKAILSHGGKRFRYINNPGRVGEFGSMELLNTTAGLCNHWAHLANNALREFGVPSAIMYTPQWANHSQGHVWNAIMDSTGQMLPYEANNGRPGRIDFMRRIFRTSKLYTLPYAKNSKSFAMQHFKISNRSVPKYLKDPCLLDVTAQFVPVNDVDIKIDYNLKMDNGYVFLCLFARGSLNAIDWTSTNESQATFHDLGRSAMYIPAFFKEGRYYSASDPISISYDGEVSRIVPDLQAKRNVRLYRKYPLKSSMFKYTRTFMGMKIQISEERTFKTPNDIHEITRWPSPIIKDWYRELDQWNWVEYRDSVSFDSLIESQYVRFFAAPGQACIVGDIECFDEVGNSISGIAYGSHDGAENVLDGTYGDAYHDPDTAGWVALDFGEKRLISKITYLPSHDSNSIQVGDNYELFYWDEKWILIEQQTAEHKYLDFEVPSNSLFWLKNIDRGKEERIFTIDETGKQIWW